jgi:hypothetical protein
MYAKKVMLVILVVMLLNGASCESPTSSGSNNVEEETFVGVQGIEMSFLEGAPPNEVYQDTDFDVYIELHNRGALDVTEGKLRMSIPLQPFDFNIDDKTQTISEITESTSIMGKENAPGGDYVTAEWNGIHAKSTSIRNDARQNIHAQLCYKGKIDAQPMVCISPRPGGKGLIEGECVIGRETYSGGNGGPIAVTAITESVLKDTETTNRIVFRMEVENVGGGDVIDESEVNGCQPTLRDKAKSTVKIEGVGWIGEETKFNCEGGKGKENEFLMLNGKGIFKCEVKDIPNDVHYSLPLYIKMNYGYVKSINKVFTLKKDVF